jgi:eukaryotic-like serine/threonine-protein kinase
MAFSLNDYQIIGEIGRGGFATVYRAKQKSLGKEVAIKCLSPKRTQNSGEIARFRREAEAMATLTHDNIVSVIDYAFQDGSYYIVMEYVEGLGFDEAIESGLPQECCLYIMEKTAGALVYAHAENIIHRDIKPANILLGRNGQVKLADFGLAMFSSNLETLTAPGSVLGTVSFLAPEALATPDEVDGRVDVFSLGCMLYRIAAGKLPFEGASFGEISYKILNADPKPPALSGLPASLLPMTMRCLAKDRDLRPSIKELHAYLQEITRDRYHAAQESLVSFVRRERGSGSPSAIAAVTATPAAPEKPGATAITTETPSSPKTSERRRRFFIPAAIMIILCAVLGWSLYSHLSSSRKPVRISLLPTLPAGGGESGQPLLPDGKGTPLLKNGPSPITGTPIDMKIGVLVFRGLQERDSVLLNGKPAAPFACGGDRCVETAPRYYTIVVKRDGAQLMTVGIDLLPYQHRVIELPLRKEK